MDKIISLINKEPVVFWTGLVTGLVGLAVQYGLPINTEEKTWIVTGAGFLFSWVARQHVSPNQPVQPPSTTE